MGRYASGHVIGERYEIQRSLGAGGMAEVYLALDQRLHRPVAIKVLDPESSADEHFVERSRREARAAAALNHPNIVSVYDWGADGDTYYMVMEYVDGENLRQTMRRRGPLPEHEALEIATKVAFALQHAHDHGVIHRDIKPANILLDERGEVKVADFGIARTAGLTALTSTNVLSGTALYMSPEQAQLQPLDGRSDVYSLGVVLYEMLTDRTPFDGDSLIEVALQHVQAPVPSVRDCLPTISTEADTIVDRALQKAPAHRFPTAREMGLTLQAASESRAALPVAPIQPVPEREWSESGSRERTRQLRQGGSRRRWWLPGSVILVGLGVVAGAVLLVRHPPRSSPHAAFHLTSSVPTATRVPSLAPTTPAGAPTVPPTIPPSSPHTPLQVVSSFYADIIQGNYSAAASLWSSALRSRDPPTAYIDQRFAGTQELNPTVSLQSENVTAGTATVNIDLQERQGGVRHHYTGAWYLVRQGSQWVMNSEYLNCRVDGPGYSCPG